MELEKFRRIEQVLYDYPVMKAFIAWTELLATAPGIPCLEYKGKSSDPSNPTHSAAMSLDDNEDYKEAKDIIKHIDLALERMSIPTRRVIEGVYFKGRHKTQEGIAMDLNMSRRQIHRIRKWAIHFIGEYLKDVTNI